MSRVPWERYVGDDIEAVIAVMLLREHPAGQRIRPSRGDGGVDVLIPVSETLWEVYQVKGFTVSLNASQKSQIKKSWDRLRTFVAQRQVEVSAWHVVRPLDPTHEDRDWLAELTDGASIPTDWIGLSTVDGWAAKYPEVIDYYLRDSKERVLEQAKYLLSADSLRKNSLTVPADATDGLESLHRALNSSDPHYRYDLHVEYVRNPGEFTYPPEIPGLVFSTTRERNGVAVRIDVIARYNDAVKDRPVKFNTVLRPGDSAEKKQLRDFLEYGKPLVRMPASLDADLPGGFTVSDSASATISFLPTREQAITRDHELIVASNEGIVLSRLTLMMQAPTRGLDGRKFAWDGHDVSGVVTIGIQHDPATKTTSIWTSAGDITGTNPADAARALAALSTMTEGVTLSLSLRDGPTVLQMADIPESLVDEAAVDLRLSVCRSLAELQHQIPIPIVVPSAATVTNQEMKGWHDAASLLRGEVVSRSWTSLGMTHSADSPMHLPGRVRITRDLTVSIGDRPWVLGLIDQTVVAAKWAPDSPGAAQGRLLPSEEFGSIMIASMATDTDARSRAARGVIQMGPLVSTAEEATLG